MLKINSKQIENQLTVEQLSGELLLNGKNVDYDLIKESEIRYHLIKDNKSYNLEVLSLDTAKKEFVIKVNGKVYDLKASDKYDELLSKRGISRGAAAKVNELKAPMPGLVFDVKVEVGQQVAEGEPLMILEAMKMENVLKAPADVTIKSIEIEKQEAVEKNQILIKFDN